MLNERRSAMHDLRRAAIAAMASRVANGHEPRVWVCRDCGVAGGRDTCCVESRSNQMIRELEAAENADRSNGF